MALNANETIIKAAGDVYRAALGTGAPSEEDLTDSGALVSAGFVHMGWLHEDGPSFDGFEGEVQRFNGWNRQAPVRVRSIIGEPTVTVPLTQWNVENASLYFPGSEVDIASGNLVVPSTPGTAIEQELLVVVQDGSESFGFWAAKTSPRPGGPLEFPGDDFSQIQVTFDVLAPDSDEDGLVQIIGLDEAESS